MLRITIDNVRGGQFVSKKTYVVYDDGRIATTTPAGARYTTPQAALDDIGQILYEHLTGVETETL